MSDLPEGWSSCSPLEVADLIRGVSYKKGEASTEAAPGLVPLLRANNIDAGRLNFDNLLFVPDNRVSSEQRLRAGDVVLAMSSGSQAVVGKAASLSMHWQGTFGAFCGVLRAAAEIDAGYFGLFLQTGSYRKGMSALAAGTNINNIKRQYFEEFTLPVPPLAEQKRIVEQVEALIAQAQRVADRLTRLSRILGGAASPAVGLGHFVQIVLAKAFSAGLVPTEAELARTEGRGYESGEELLARVRGARVEPAAGGRKMLRRRTARRG